MPNEEKAEQVSTPNDVIKRLGVMGIDPSQYPSLYSRLVVCIGNDELDRIGELVEILERFHRVGRISAPSSQRAFWSDGD